MSYLIRKNTTNAIFNYRCKLTENARHIVQYSSFIVHQNPIETREILMRNKWRILHYWEQEHCIMINCWPNPTAWWDTSPKSTGAIGLQRYLTGLTYPWQRPLPSLSMVFTISVWQQSLNRRNIQLVLAGQANYASGYGGSVSHAKSSIRTTNNNTTVEALSTPIWYRQQHSGAIFLLETHKISHRHVILTIPTCTKLHDCAFM